LADLQFKFADVLIADFCPMHKHCVQKNNLSNKIIIYNDYDQLWSTMIDFSRKKEDISRFLKIHFLSMHCHIGLCFNVVLRKSVIIVSELRALQILLQKRYARLYTEASYEWPGAPAQMGNPSYWPVCHVPNEKQKKLDSKVIEVIFVGYDGISKA